MIPQSQRQQFLSSHWVAYPEAPHKTCGVSHPERGQALWVAGKLLDLKVEESSSTSDVEFFLSLGDLRGHENYQGRGLALFIWNGQILQETQQKAWEVLVCGDEVAIQKVSPNQTMIVLLAPCLAPFPSSPVSFDRSLKWGEFVKNLRDYLGGLNFHEVQTPSLVPCPGLEPHLEPFVTQLKLGSHHQRFFLPTSPEFHLKKLMAQGWGAIFEIRSCFRNEEISDQHWPEFTMCEWYRVYEGSHKIVEDLIEFIGHMKNSGFVKGPVGTVETWTVAELFKKIFNFDLKPTTSGEDLFQLAARFHVRTCQDDDENEVFHRLWIEHIDPWIYSRPGPQIVRDWPPSQAALARWTQAGWADRVEVYWRGFELANGYAELNDPVEQQRRFLQDLESRQRLHRTVVPLDEEFIKALQAGLPPSAGLAVGLERLFMAAQKLSSISDLRYFKILSGGHFCLS